jgi:hypothetical protein
MLPVPYHLHSSTVLLKVFIIAPRDVFRKRTPTKRKLLSSGFLFQPYTSGCFSPRATLRVAKCPYGNGALLPGACSSEAQKLLGRIAKIIGERKIFAPR